MQNNTTTETETNNEEMTSNLLPLFTEPGSFEDFDDYDPSLEILPDEDDEVI